MAASNSSEEYQTGLEGSARSGTKKSGRFPLITFLILAASLSLYRFLEVSSSRSFGWDSAGFLSNGAVYSGYAQYQQAYDPSKPPFLPTMLSLMFRVTGPSAYEGYILSGLLYFLAMFGCYLLARMVMNSWLAILPALSFGVAPMVVMWEGFVYSNVEGVAIASLGLAALVYAARGERYFLLALPLLFLAPLTRYTLGVVIFAALVFLIASGKFKRVFRNRHFQIGLGLAIVLSLLFMAQWVEYPIIHDLPLSSLFPKPKQLNPFENPLGHSFFALTLPSELGAGWYGYIVVIALVGALAFGLTRLLIYVRNSKQSRSSSSLRDSYRKYPIIAALFTWFIFLILYYSLFWPYDDPRYSIEFILPALILAYWGIDSALSPLYSYRRKAGRNIALSSAALVVVIIVSFVIAVAATQSGLLVLRNTPVVDTHLNAGMRQAANWVQSNVPTNVKIEGDWYTFLRWDLPNYNSTPAPASYQLQTSSDYQAWLNTISQNDIGYVIYSNPYDINVPSQLHPVFESTVGGVVVYQVIEA